MSYDIEVIQKRDEFGKYLVDNGGKAEGKSVLITNDKPAMAIEYNDGWFNFNYCRNHFHVFFAYNLLGIAMNKIPGLEFKDNQSGLTINSTNASVVTGDYLRKLAEDYTQTGWNTVKAMEATGSVRIDGGGMTPVPMAIMERLSRDLYFHSYYKERTREVYGDVFFPKPMVLVNPKAKVIQIVYSWVDFIDQVFPVEVDIDTIVFSLWDTKNNALGKTTKYSAKELFTRLPKPEVVEDKELGRRLLYKDLSQNGEEYVEILNGLVPVEHDKGYSFDERMGSLFSVP